MKILVTGAHFSVAAAVIEQLKKIRGMEIVYVGRKSTLEGFGGESLESMELPKMGVKFIPLTAGRLQRSFSWHTIPSLLKIPIGFVQAGWILVRERPEEVVSFGGYVSVPVVVWAWLLSIPILVHEQTLVTGLSNWVGGLLADRVAVSFDVEYGFDPKKVVLSGNPIRSERHSCTCNSIPK